MTLISKGINSLEDMPLRNVLVADERLAYNGAFTMIIFYGMKLLAILEL